MPENIPRDVVCVINNTHLHFDYCGGNHLFPGVPIHVQRLEKQGPSHPPEWVDFPHMPGHQSVLVQTPDGVVVVCGDVAYTFDELESGATHWRTVQPLLYILPVPSPPDVISMRARTRMLPAVVAVLVVCVTAVTASAQSSEWHYRYFHLNAYSSTFNVAALLQGTSRGCAMDSGTWKLMTSFSEDPIKGECRAAGETLAHSAPFTGDVLWKWSRVHQACDAGPKPAGYHSTMYLHTQDGRSYLCGWIDWHWGTFAVTRGKLHIGGSELAVEKTGTDVKIRGHKEGPLYMVLGARSEPGGFVLRMTGWLRY